MRIEGIGSTIVLCMAVIAVLFHGNISGLLLLLFLLFVLFWLLFVVDLVP